MTDVETLQAAIRELHDRPTGLPKSCNPLIAAALSAWAETASIDPDLLHRAGGPETITLARAITGHASQRECACGRAPDPGICPNDCGPGRPGSGHCACVHEEQQAADRYDHLAQLGRVLAAHTLLTEAS